MPYVRFKRYSVEQNLWLLGDDNSVTEATGACKGAYNLESQSISRTELRVDDRSGAGSIDEPLRTSRPLLQPRPASI